MKRLFLTIAVLAVATVCANASNHVTKKFNNSGFVGLSVSGSFNVELIKSETFRVEVDVPEDYLPYVSVTQESGKLIIGFSDDMPRKLKTFKGLRDIDAHVAMPELYLLELSGSSELECEQEFYSEMHRIDISVSGSSKLSGIKVKAPIVGVTVSGSSKVTMEANTSDLKLDVSGASKANVSGEASDVDMTVGGASSVNCEKLKNNYVKLDEGGASRVDLFVGGQFIVEVGGASKCVYYTEGPINLDVKGVTGASTFKKGEPKKND